MIEIEHTGSGEIFYATTYSAGFDICSNEDDYILNPGEWHNFKTGMRIKNFNGVFLENWIQTIDGNNTYYIKKFIVELQIRPRSGLATKFGITVLNSPSTIDSDYRGEIIVSLINLSKLDYTVCRGDRIAQGVCALIYQVPNIPVRQVERGENGFGSTGK